MNVQPHAGREISPNLCARERAGSKVKKTCMRVRSTLDFTMGITHELDIGIVYTGLIPQTI